MQAWLRELDALKTQFGPEPARRKRELLRSSASRSFRAALDLFAFHEALCFIRAFPDDREVLSLAEGALQTFSRRVIPFQRKLVDTGIAGTAYHYPFGLPMARWLLDRYGGAVEIDWESFNEREEDDLTPLLVTLSAWPEAAGLDDEKLSIEDWFDSTRPKGAGALRRILRRLEASAFPPEIQETIYNGLYLPVRWNLGDSDGSRTTARSEEPETFYHKEPLLGRTKDLRGDIEQKLERTAPVSVTRARGWIDLARRALSVRERELHPLALANESEVYETRIGRGIRLILIGMLPDRRLPIETDYAAFFVKNGVPIGYGIGAILLDRLEIAVNVFPTFRQGESSFLFAQLARLFHHQFGCDVFLVERYQLGHENDEGLEAGSFWFYYKLGFRPVDRESRRMAERESFRLLEKHGSRSPRSLLRRLARSDVQLFLDESRTEWPAVPLTEIGMAVTRWIETSYDGDVRRAEIACADEVARILGAEDRMGWPDAERRSFERLSPMIRLIPDLDAWSSQERASLIDVLRAKGQACEAEYARQAMRHRRLCEALTRKDWTARAAD